MNAGMGIDRKKVRQQWLSAGHTKENAAAAALNAHIIGYTRANGRWVPVLSTDLACEYEER